MANTFSQICNVCRKIPHDSPLPIHELPFTIHQPMKRCPQCNRVETDEALKFCRVDGATLIADSGSISGEAGTVKFGSGAVSSEIETSVLPHRTDADAGRSTAPTTVLPPQTESNATLELSTSKGRTAGLKQNKPLVGLLIVAILIGVGIVAVGLRYVVQRSSLFSNRPVAGSNMKLQRLTTSGRAWDAGISPDGKWVAHVKSDAGQQSLWLRQVETTSDTQIVPPSRQNYYGITFSKDGNYIYYALGEPTRIFWRTLYQVPTLGGASRKVIENMTSPISLSPDGKRLAFIRINPTSGETALVVANADGTGERQLAVRRLPNTFSSSGPSWSPDGKLIALGVANYDPAGSGLSSTVVEVMVESGAERPITSQKWSSVGQVAWLANGSGLALIAAEQGPSFQGQGVPSSFQIWHISYPDGATRKITNDLNNYNRVSLTADSSTLVTVQTDSTSNVWVAPQGDASRARQISSGNYDGSLGLSWMPGFKLVFTSRESGSPDIWSMDQDGKNQRQLTAQVRFNYFPWATSDGRYIVFTSTRAGAARSTIWRMDTDGGNLKQLTDGPGDVLPQSSPDGRWVVFHSARSGVFSIWKVSIDGGEPVRLTDRFTLNPTVSPDGSMMACFYREDQPNAPFKVAIIPFAGGDPVKVLDIPHSVHGPAGLRWTPDGRALTYIDTINGVSNIWSLPLDGGKPVPLTDFKTDRIFWFDLSRDGKQLALSRGEQTSDVILIRDFR